MKKTTYVLTFLAYVSLHTMRMTYSYVKPRFQHTFGLGNVIMGVFDGLIYLSLGVGFFFRFRTEGAMKPIHAFFLFGVFSSVAYACIPIMSLLWSQGDHFMEPNVFVRCVAPGLALMTFGFCQFSAWPVLLYLVSQHFDVEKEGTLMGIWSANGDIGNITGFLLASLVVKTVESRWEYAMLAAALFNLGFSFLVRLFVKDQQHKTVVPQDETEVRGVQSGEEKFALYLTYCKQIISKPENRLYLASLALLKSILYGFLLWIPTFLTHNGFEDYASLLPILFNFSTVFGSAFLGCIYNQNDNANADHKSVYHCLKHLKSYSLFYSCFFLALALGFFYAIDNSIIIYLSLAGIIGFFLGGSFNMLASNEVMAITHGDQVKVGMLSTLAMAVGNLVVGVVEILIGVVMDVKGDPQGENRLFIVLIAVSVGAMILVFWRSRLHYKRMRDESVLIKLIADSKADL